MVLGNSERLFVEKLNVLKADALKLVAAKCGSTITGNKIDIARHLYAKSTLRPAKDQPLSVISVDLGLKNIGVSQFQVAPGEKPLVKVWERWSLPEKFKFTYPEISDHAIDLIHRLHGLHSDETVKAIVIEKQRARSGGAASVPHDILRVNVLEGMVFTGLRAAYPSTLVESVDPKAIVTYWRTGDNRPEMQAISPAVVKAETKLTPSQQYAASKKIRHALVRQWLGGDENDRPFDIAEQIHHSARGSKQDDLNDSLVQGATWLQWVAAYHDLLKALEDGSLEAWLGQVGIAQKRTKP